MASIYNIQQDLLSIFAAIEDNDGELTSELEEALDIKQDEFKDKIEAYSNVVKQLDSDISAIKEEKARLNTLQKSKEKTIERIKAVMVEAIKLFGSSNKTGSKFIDYGTGKVSLRRSEVIEVDEEGTKQFVNRFFNYFIWLNYTNTFDQQELNYKDILEYCNNSADANNEENITTKYTESDLDMLQANVGVKLNLKELLNNPKGKVLIKALLDYTTVIDSVAVVDKANLKKNFKATGKIPTFSNYVEKENVTFK